MRSNKKYKNPICGIYAIWNKVENKSYIGQAKIIQARWTSHKSYLNTNTHVNKRLNEDWNKYGENAFELIELFQCNEEDLDYYEDLFISLFDATNEKYGYNLISGNYGISETNENYSEFRSKMMKEQYEKNPERKQHMSESMKAIFSSEEKRQMARERAIKQFSDPAFYTYYREYRASEEFKEKLRKANTGKKQSEETIKKIIETSGTPVRCVETGVVYPSAKEAARCIPGNVNINAVLSGRRNTAGGFHWERLEK